LDFPTDETYRKELGKRQKKLKKKVWYHPSSTLALVRKWGPSTRNILRSMEYTASGDVDPIEEETKTAAIAIWNNPRLILGTSIDLVPQSEGSSLVFLRRARNGSVTLGEGKRFIPTPYLRALFEAQRPAMENNESL